LWDRDLLAPAGHGHALDGREPAAADLDRHPRQLTSRPGSSGESNGRRNHLDVIPDGQLAPGLDRFLLRSGGGQPLGELAEVALESRGRQDYKTPGGLRTGVPERVRQAL